VDHSLDADVAVVGAGPAGAAAAAACAASGLRVALVDADPDRRWAATYGAWEDEFPAHVPVPVRVRWPTVTVRAGREHRLARPYVVLDNARLSGSLRAVLLECGGSVHAARVAGVQHFTWGSRLGGDGTSLDVGLVVDASGARSAFVARPPARRAPALQTACGIVARLAHPPAEPGTCLLMDWSAQPHDAPDPTFLYALDLGDGTWLAEETSLARRPALGIDVLRERLARRLTAAGAEPTVVLATEHVAIPLDLPVPPGDQPVVGFGAAASLVHPASGYSVAVALRAAPALAGAVRAARDRRAGPAATARAAWSAIWPGARRRSRALEEYGLDVITRMSAGDMRAFFDAFFTRPVDAWAPYLAGTATPRQIARFMTSVFAGCPASTRRVLLAGDRLRLLRAVV
jgi:lycopene beta-cyclase